MPFPISEHSVLVISNLSHISHRFQDMPSFLFKNAHLSYPPLHFTPNYKNVLLGVDR